MELQGVRRLRGADMFPPPFSAKPAWLAARTSHSSAKSPLWFLYVRKRPALVLDSGGSMRAGYVLQPSSKAR